MKRKKKIAATVCGVTLVVLWLISFLSPELAIRRYVFFHLRPIQSIQIDIHNMERLDREYGHLYNVNGYVNHQTKDELNVFYLKRHGMIWTVDSVGTGP